MGKVERADLGERAGETYAVGAAMQRAERLQVRTNRQLDLIVEVGAEIGKVDADQKWVRPVADRSPDRQARLIHLG